MKVGILRFAVVAVMTGLLLVAGSATAWAQSPNYTPGFGSNQNLMNLNGNGNGSPAFTSTDSGTVLRLTPAAGNRVGSAWFNVQQPVKNGFTTTFTFQLSPSDGGHGDGIAFVIQNAAAGVGAIGFTGGNGGALGYGDHDSATDLPDAGEGIPNSLAIEFDTYKNDWDPNDSHVAIQSCGTGKNTSHHDRLCSASGSSSTLLEPVSLPNLADGETHTATVTYTICSDCSTGSLQVTIGDNTQTISVNLGTLLNLTNGNAYVGFTSATGAAVEDQDIVSWTFQANVPPGATTVFNFPNHNYEVTPVNTQAATTVQITPLLVTQAACNALVQANPAFVTTGLTAQCFVYRNADGLGNDRSVLYEVTCPELTNGECSPFDAELGSTYDLPTVGNPGLNPSNPFPGWLKGHGTDPNHPCANNNPPLFVSNQVSFFDISVNDPVTKGKSGGTGSCWVATYNTPNEAPTVSVITPANGANYPQGPTVNSNFSCTAVSTTPGSPIGPYLTVPAGNCTATVDGGSPIGSGSPINTSTLGPHTFIAKVTDSATDNATSTPITYTVVGPTDLAILNLGLTKIAVGKTLTYAIGVGNLGSANAVGVNVTDTLPPNTTLVSASGSNVSCAVVNRKLTCSTTPITCSAGPTVSCPVANLAPLSWSSLNGATIQIKVLVNAAAVNTTLSDTATVTGSNFDPKLGNNSSTVKTSVTAH